jgi:hypothetical protein
MDQVENEDSPGEEKEKERMTFLTRNRKQSGKTVAAAALSAALLLVGFPAYAQYAEYNDHDAGYMNDSIYNDDWFYDYYDYDNWETDYYDGEFGYGDDADDYDTKLFYDHPSIEAGMHNKGTEIYDNDYFDGGFLDDKDRLGAGAYDDYDNEGFERGVFAQPFYNDDIWNSEDNVLTPNDRYDQLGFDFNRGMFDDAGEWEAFDY